MKTIIKIITYPIKQLFRLLYWLTLKLHSLLAYVLPSRKTAGKTIFYQLFVLGWVMAAFFARQQYVITCSAGGHFMTQTECHDLAEAKADSQELARQEWLAVKDVPAESKNCVGNDDVCE